MENLLNKYDNEIKQLERLKKDLLELRLTYRRNKEQIPQWLHRRFQDVIRDIAMCARNTQWILRKMKENQENFSNYRNADEDQSTT